MCVFTLARESLTPLCASLVDDPLRHHLPTVRDFLIAIPRMRRSLKRRPAPRLGARHNLCAAAEWCVLVESART